MKVKAAVLYELGGRLEVEDIELADPEENEVLVKVSAAGVCHSDISVIDGVIPFPLPAVLGHEGSGVVESVGPGVDHLQPGDHVIFSFIPACGECFYCMRGMRNLCEPSLRLGGSLFDGTSRLTNSKGASVNHFSCTACFGEYTVVPEHGAIKIDPDVPLDNVALIGCCVTTGVGAVFNTAKVEPGSSVAVFGCGGVGLSIVQGAAISGAQPVIALDLWAERPGLARELGATHTINASTEDGTRQIREWTDGKVVDYAFEAIGNPDVFSQAYRSIHWGETCVCGGVPAADAKLTFDSRLIMQERQEGEEFIIYFLRNTLTGGFPKEAYLDMGFNKAEIAKIRKLRKEKAQSADFAMFRALSLFKKQMHSTLVNNLHRCGVLSETMKTKLEQELLVNVVEHLAAD